VDLAANAESLGARVFRATDIDSLNIALGEARKEQHTTVIYIKTVPERKMAGYGYAWWDVPVAEVSESESVQKARENYELQKKKQRYFF
jgi:3D-(3,5/4)-trihydroxycyclohexane-1,2-dione acylhydrolase (decyclizing)